MHLAQRTSAGVSSKHGMKTVVTCNTLPEAELLRSVIEAEGITVAIPGENTPQPIAGFPSGYAVQVPDESFERAVELLRDAGYGPASATLTSPTAAMRVAAPAAPGLRLFRWLVVIDMLLTIGLWVDGHGAHLDLPPEVNAYLDSLAASDALWEIGYLVSNTAMGFGLIGSLFLLFRARLGLYLFGGGLLVQIFWVWVFPGGIYHGWSGTLGAIELVLSGFIIGFAVFRPVLGPEPAIGKR